MKRNLLWAIGAVAALTIAAACSGDDGSVVRAPTTGATDSEIAEIDFLSSSGIVGGDPDFNLSALVWQGYWLSRDHFGPFVMASGMGIPFEPPMEAVMGAISMIAQNPDDPVVVPQNMLPLQAVYAFGSADLINDPRDFGPMDFEAFRLDPATFAQTISVRGQAQTMLKESQWAHSFADPHFGDPAGDFGAQQRFIGMMVSMLAQMQGVYAMQNLLADDGLYYDSDGELDYVANWVMLHTLSDIAGLTGDSGGRYANPDAHDMFEEAAAQLFLALEEREPQSARESAAAVRALAYLASTTTQSDLADDALAKLTTVAVNQLSDLTSTEIVEIAAGIAGLISTAEAVPDGAGFKNAADVLFRQLADDFDGLNGVFESQSVYTADDVAWIIGGLNSLVQKGNATVQAEAASVLLAFYESTLSVAGMQLSAPPGKNGAMAGEFELNLPSVVYYHPANTPAPAMAGKLMVPAEEITWDGTTWQVTSDRYASGGAMHLSNELNWLGPHLGSVPFPLSTANPPAPSRTETTTSPTIVGENIAFDTVSLTVPAGEEVTITFDNRDDGVPHNLHIQAGSPGNVRTEIVAGPVVQKLTFTIDTPGEYAYVCDVHPALMVGTIIVE